jgi:Ca2+-binding RTX toxin-like protein
MGIRLVVGSAYSLDMSDYDFTGVDDAEITKFTSITIKGTAGLFALTVKGSGFSHDQLGYLTGGTIESVSLTYHHESILSLSGAHVSVEKLIDVLSSASSSDDIALLKSTLGGDDYISGSQYGDHINAYGGNDTLLGRDGSDKIRGGAGNDRLIGGAGSDDLHGDGGKDTFIFKSVRDSKAAGADTIYDFSSRDGDRIDLSEIDANEKTSGNQAFKFIGDHAFHHKAGELRFEKSGGDTWVYGDTDGDGNADLAIHLNGHPGLKGSAFDL